MDSIFQYFSYTVGFLMNDLSVTLTSYDGDRRNVHFRGCCLYFGKPFWLLLLEVEIKYEIWITKLMFRVSYKSNEASICFVLQDLRKIISIFNELYV